VATPVFQSITSYPPSSTTAATTSAVWAYPSGIQLGDVLVLAAVNNNPGGGTATTFTTPTGWTLKQSSPGLLTDVSTYLFTKIAAGTESGTNITLTASASALIAAGLLRYSSNDKVTPLGSTSKAVSSAASTSSPAAATLSPAPGADDMVVRMYGWAQDSSATGVASTIPTGTGWTTRLNNFTNTGTFQCGCVVLDKAAGTGTVTVTNVSSAWMVSDVDIHAAPSNFMPFFM